MIDLGREIEAAVRVDWDDDRHDVVRAGIDRRRRRQTATRASLGAAATLAVVLACWLAWGNRAPNAPVATQAVEPVAAPPMLRFADGSTAARLGSDTVLRAATEPMAVELAHGAARFEVVDDRTRVFRVESGPVRVQTYGAVFASAVSDQRTHVEVFRGTVTVLWDDQQRVLAAGEQGVFPPLPPAKPTPAIVAPVRPVPARPPASPTAAQTREGWRELARDGEYDRAYAVIAAVRDEPEELLLAADVKRLSHHPAEAIEPLRAVVRDHASDPRAPLAAFTLGRVLLEELGRPAEAADAFADAVRLAPSGPMAEDALAREVEAQSRAGEPAAAKRLAQQYVAQFPTGRKLKSVRRFGALE